MNLVSAVFQLFTTGDYQGWMVPVLGEEDSPLVDLILTARETWEV